MRFFRLASLTLILLTTPTSPAAGAELPARPLEESLFKLAADLSNGLEDRRIRTVTVRTFEDKGRSDSELGRYISGLLTHHLLQISPTLKLVERESLGEILEEQKLGLWGLLDSEAPSSLGDLLGTDGLIVGSSMDTGDSLVIQARLIQADSGAILTAATVTAAKNAAVRAMLDEVSGPSYQDEFLRASIYKATLLSNRRASVMLKIENRTASNLYLAAEVIPNEGCGITLRDSEGRVIPVDRHAIDNLPCIYSGRGAVDSYANVTPNASATARLPFEVEDGADLVGDRSFTLEIKMLRHKDGKWFPFPLVIPNVTLASQ